MSISYAASYDHRTRLIDQPTRSVYPNFVNGKKPQLPAARHNHRPAPVVSTAALAPELPEMLLSAQNGDEFAFAALIRQYRRLAETAARRILQTEEAAADAVQEALYKVYRSLHTFQHGNFRSWLLRIVKNTCYDHLRKQARQQAMSLDELTENGSVDVLTAPSDFCAQDNPEEVAVQRETMSLLLGAIEDLPTTYRTIIMLVDVHGLDYREAACTSIFQWVR
ncbi:MAG: RNA polymerase sigma factor [Caldilineaceae bacterium]